MVDASTTYGCPSLSMMSTPPKSMANARAVRKVRSRSSGPGMNGSPCFSASVRAGKTFFTPNTRSPITYIFRSRPWGGGERARWWGGRAGREGGARGRTRGRELRGRPDHADALSGRARVRLDHNGAVVEQRGELIGLGRGVRRGRRHAQIGRAHV